MTSRDQILKKLRAVRQPFTDIPPVEERRHMVPLEDLSSAGLRERFIMEAEKLKCKVWQVEDAESANQKLLELIGEEKCILSWSPPHIPIDGLESMLSSAGITIADPHDGNVKVGVSGVSAALAATGSLVIVSGEGKSRSASLFPTVYIAVIQENQIVPDLETWFIRQREAGLDQFREASNTVVVSGPSKSADIGMELVVGAHGPAKVHVILLPK
jgi:L-lactate dehydrogenase complex protein LldG